MCSVMCVCVCTCAGVGVGLFSVRHLDFSLHPRAPGRECRMVCGSTLASNMNSHTNSPGQQRPS